MGGKIRSFGNGNEFCHHAAGVFVGAFYSVQQLPDFAFWVTQYNPFFYMIDGFRYALTGHAEGSLISAQAC